MFDFPNAPTNGQQVVTPDGVVYVWDTVKWHTGTAPVAFVRKSGDIMTGPLTLYGDPTTSLQASTKAYTDTKLPLAGGTMTGPLTMAGDPTQPLHAATKAYSDGTFVHKTGDSMSGTLRVTNGRIMSQSGSNPTLTVYDTAQNYAAGMFMGGSATLYFSQMDGNGAYNGTWLGYFNSNGDFWARNALTGTYVHSTGNVDADVQVKGGGSYLGTWGVLGSAMGLGWWMNFNWDGTNVPAYANGNYACTLVSSTWVSNNFKSIGAYTPNQNVDYNSSPSFWDMHTSKTWVNGGVWYAWGSHTFEFNWNGRVQCSVDNGGAIVTFPHEGSDFGGNNITGNYVRSNGWIDGGFNGTGIHSYGQLNADGEAHISQACFSNWIVTTAVNGNVWGFWQSGNNAYLRYAGAYDYYAPYASDARLKEEVVPSEVNCLDWVKRIKLHQFRWREDSGRREPGNGLVPVGFLTQQLREAGLDDLVLGEPEDLPPYGIPGAFFPEGVKPDVLSALLVGAIHQLAKRIEAGGL